MAIRNYIFKRDIIIFVKLNLLCLSPIRSAHLDEIDLATRVRVEGLEDVAAELVGFAMRIELLIDINELFLVEFALRTVLDEAGVPLFDLLAVEVRIVEQEADLVLGELGRVVLLLLLRVVRHWLLVTHSCLLACLLGTHTRSLSHTHARTHTHTLVRSLIVGCKDA